MSFPKLELEEPISSTLTWYGVLTDTLVHLFFAPQYNLPPPPPPPLYHISPKLLVFVNVHTHQVHSPACDLTTRVLYSPPFYSVFAKLRLIHL